MAITGPPMAPAKPSSRLSRNSDCHARLPARPHHTPRNASPLFAGGHRKQALLPAPLRSFRLHSGRRRLELPHQPHRPLVQCVDLEQQMASRAIPLDSPRTLHGWVIARMTAALSSPTYRSDFQQRSAPVPHPTGIGSRFPITPLRACCKRFQASQKFAIFSDGPLAGSLGG